MQNESMHDAAQEAAKKNLGEPRHTLTLKIKGGVYISVQGYAYIRVTEDLAQASALALGSGGS